MISERLHATVIRVEHGEQFTDGLPRVTLLIDQADQMYREVRFSIDTHLGETVPQLGDRFGFDLMAEAVRP